MTTIRRAILPVATAALIGFGLVLGISAPPEVNQGDFAKMLFIHVPSVLAAYLGFAVALVGAVWYLATRNPVADRVSASSVEVGVLFVGLTLATGSIWGRPVWGVWWDWGDARMVSTAVMFFFYLGILALRRSIENPTLRAQRSAWLAIIAFVQVPIVHFSVTWFRTLHQPATILRVDVENAPIDPVFGQALGVNILAFVLLYVFLLSVRTKLAALRAEEHAVYDTAPAGAGISPPEFGGANG